MKHLLALVLGMNVLAACGTDTHSSTTASEKRPPFHSGNFVLFAAPRHVATGCDRFTKIELASTAAGDTATLFDGVSGLCEIFIPRNDRSYKLTTTSIGCGSLEHVELRATTEKPRIKITDHRARVCKDIQPARIIVQELVGDEYQIKYSDDKVRAQSEEIIIGTLQRLPDLTMVINADGKSIPVAFATQDLTDQAAELLGTGVQVQIFGKKKGDVFVATKLSRLDVVN